MFMVTAPPPKKKNTKKKFCWEGSHHPKDRIVQLLIIHVAATRWNFSSQLIPHQYHAIIDNLANWNDELNILLFRFLFQTWDTAP